MLNKIKEMARPVSRAYLVNEICPYCFEKYKLRQTPFRCANHGSKCAHRKDEVKAKVWKIETPTGKVLEPTGWFAYKMRCSVCGESSRKRICPHCHMDLPNSTGKFRNYIFAIIGAKDSGKSHYLAVLIEQIKQWVGPSLGLLLSELGEHTIKRYRESFYDPVYKNHKVIRNTVSAFVDPEVKLPLVFDLGFQKKAKSAKPRITNSVTLVFFDTAGEDLNNQDTMAVVNRYIYQSDGIILLLDPLQLPWVRDQLGERVPLPKENIEISDIVIRTTNLIQEGRQFAHNDYVPIPLAVAFSKFDAVQSLIDPQFQLNAQSNHTAGFDARDFEAINSEMQSLLSAWHGNFLIEQVTSRYKNVGFFGLSALGCNPHGDNKIPRVIPKRIEDPFLWLLHHHKLIKSAKY